MSESAALKLTDSGVLVGDLPANASAMEQTEIFDRSRSKLQAGDDEEEEEEEPDCEPPDTLEAALQQLHFLTQTKTGLERTLRVRNEEIQQLRTQVRAASGLSHASLFHIPENPSPPAAVPSVGQLQQSLRDEYSTLKAEYVQLQQRYAQAQDVMFQCNQAEDMAKEKTAAMETANSLLNEELASTRQRYDDMSAKCQALHVEGGDLRATMEEMEVRHKKALADEVERKCQDRLARYQEQHTADMMQLVARRQELQMLADQQKEKIRSLQHRLEAYEGSPTSPDSGRSRSNTLPVLTSSPEVIDECEEARSRIGSLPNEALSTKSERSMFSLSLPMGIKRPASLPAGSNNRSGVFSFRRSRSDMDEPPGPLKNALQGLRSSLSEKIKEISQVKEQSVSDNPVHKPPPPILGMAQMPRNIDRPWSPHEGELTAIQFSPRGTYLATGSSDCLVKLWEEGCREFTMHRQLKGCTKSIAQLDFDADESCVLAACNDRSVQVWPLTIGSSGRHEIFNHGDRVVSARFLSGDAYKLVSSSFDRNLRIWDVPAGKCITTQLVRSTCVDLVSPSSDMSIPVVSAHMNGTLQIYDTRLRSMSDGMAFTGSKLNSMALSPNHRQVACLMNQREVCVVDVRRFNTIYTLCADGFTTSKSARVVYSCDGDYIACGGASLFIWSTKTGKLVKECEMTKGTLPMFACSWYPSGASFLTAHTNGVNIWRC